MIRSVVLVALLLFSGQEANATTCAAATILNPASLPITNQALVCGGANDLNSTNVPGALCGTGDNAGYKNGVEALYRLTPTTTGAYSINVTGQTWSSIQVWAGCPNAGGTCVFGDGNAANTTTITVTLTAGVQYFIWFDTWPTPNSPCPGTFSIGPPAAAPTNDNPCGATPLTVNGTCVYSNSTTAGATATTGPPAPGCANYVGADVWFSVVVPASGNLILDSNTGVVTDGGMALYSATSCSGTFTLIECDDDDSPNGLMPSITRTGLTPGSTVYVRFWEYGGDNNGTFSICATQPPAPQGNDNPCGALALPVNTSCVNTASTTAGATATTGPPAPTCANYVGSDVWFSAVVPANGSLIIETTAGVVTDGGMALYTAPSCSGTFTQIACDDDGGPGLMPLISQTGLAPGTTVYIRFWEYGGDNNGTFSICVRTTPPPPAGDCVYVLNLFDSFGDGWGTSSVGVSINGSPYTNYTVTGSTNQILIGVNIGQVIVLNYNNTGAFQGENSYTLGLSGGGVFFNSGSPPAGGISYTQTIDCQPPPSAPQDCAGGQTICGSQSFNNNSTNTGNVVDLNTSNQGCLSSGERQGTWYYFSPSASGTIGLNITPTANVDYDFAIWGPMTSITCPPASAPLRCSWAYPPNVPGYPAATAYQTGMRSTSNDASEGAGPAPPADGFTSELNVVAGQQYIMYIDNFDATGQSFSLTWQLSGGASLDCSVLAVGEVMLTAAPVGSDVEVAWSTSFERGSSHFMVQRSIDGTTFEDIALVQAEGNTNTPTSYKYMDRTARNGLNYYRISSVGTDNRVQYSPVVSVLLTGGSDIVVVPNPLKDRGILMLKAPISGAFTLRTVDPSGRIVDERSGVVAHGTDRLELEWTGLDAGSYILVVLDAHGELIGRSQFVKQ